MSRRLSRGYSPLRDKRRQSDAKWRASVATCYDALKYVVPNVKNLSKKKISKALILQECEKHIQDLEDTISYIFHVECKNQGQVALWKESDHWSQCSMEKLRADFSEKQRRVFHTSAHGRRCYNLLQDIKEEVFNMKADARQITFISEDSLNFISAAESLNDGTTDVSVVPFPVDNVNEITLSEDGTVSIQYSQISVGLDKSMTNRQDHAAGSKEGKCLPSVPDSSFGTEDSAQVRQQPRPRQRLFSQVKSDIDTALLRGLSDNSRNSSSFMLVPSSKDSCRSEQKLHIVQCVAPSATTSMSATSTSISLAVSNISGNGGVIDESHDASEDCHLKQEDFTNSLYIMSNEEEYTCLLRALDGDNDQEVPSLETPTKTTRIKRPRLTNSTTCDSDCLTNYSISCGDNIKESNCFEHDVLKNTAQKSIGNSCISHNVRNKISTLPCSVESFSNLMHLNVPDIRVEADDSSTPRSNHDPLLSSLSTPKFDLDMPLFCWTEKDLLIKRPPKYGSARKRLNFNFPSYSGWSQTSSCLLSPDKTIRTSPMLTGFTPVKLPDDVAVNSDADNPLESLASPWKTLDSPFNSRAVPQGYMDNSSAVDLEDSLLCLETFDAMDFVDGMGTEVTPAQIQAVGKTQQTEELQKAKISPLVAEPGNRMKPRCRRKLERLYDQLAPTKNVNQSDESHVVPQLNVTCWTSTPTYFPNQLNSSISEVSLDNNLVCLETLDTIELSDVIDNQS